MTTGRFTYSFICVQVYICISSWIRSLRSSENVHQRRSTKNSDREEKSDFKSGTSSDRIINNVINLAPAGKQLAKSWHTNKIGVRSAYSRVSTCRFWDLHDVSRIKRIVISCIP